MLVLSIQDISVMTKQSAHYLISWNSHNCYKSKVRKGSLHWPVVSITREWVDYSWQSQLMSTYWSICDRYRTLLTGRRFFFWMSEHTQYAKNYEDLLFVSPGIVLPLFLTLCLCLLGPLVVRSMLCRCKTLQLNEDRYEAKLWLPCLCKRPLIMDFL